MVDPPRGRVTGGEEVVLHGRGFLGHGAPVVYFGNDPARAPVVENDRRMRVRTPPQTAVGEVGVQVVFADGVAITATHGFVYDEATPGVWVRPVVNDGSQP